MKSGIYWIVGPTGKAYIGSSQNIARRLGAHRAELRRGKHKNSQLQRAVNKYGIDTFEFSTIEHCAIERLIEREQFYINSFDFSTLYNARPIAESNLGYKHRPEARAALREHMRKRWANPEARAALHERLTAPEMRAASSERARKQFANPEARAALIAHGRQALASPKVRVVLSDKKSKASNTSGYKGVSFHKAASKWVAQMRLDGNKRYLGVYATPELAYSWKLAYLAHLEYA